MTKKNNKPVDAKKSSTAQVAEAMKSGKPVSFNEPYQTSKKSK